MLTRLKKTQPMFTTVQIETSNLCNLNCKMCPRNQLGVKFKNMTYPFFKNIIKNLPSHVNAVDLTGWGEPLTNRDLFKMIRYLKRKKLIASFTTNGILLDKNKRHEVINSGLDFLTLSIDNIKPDETIGHYNMKGLENFEKLSKMKKQGLKLNFNTTLQTTNEDDVYRIVEKAKELGVSTVNLIRLDTTFGITNRPSEKDEKRIVKNAKKIARGKVKINPSFDSGIIKNRIYANHCVKLRGYIYINYDGKVTPCCSLPNYVLGDATSENLTELWTSNKFKTFREKHRNICSKCDTLLPNQIK